MSEGSIKPVILSGGSGTRLWPLSRNLHPKQFLALNDTESLFQATVRRLAALTHALPPVVICNQEHRFMVAEQLRQLGVADASIFLEPVGRNTAPAIAIAALAALEQGDPPLLVAPADHAIGDTVAFCARVRAALPAARAGELVTFGVQPTHPATGFGYIKPSSPALHGGDAFRVERFIEKPDPATARALLAAGGHLWNSGIFLFRASAYLEELQRHAPPIAAASRRAYEGRRDDLDFIRLDPGAMESCPCESIDCAVMERTDRACVIPLDVAWNDLGSWAALAESSAADAQGNVAVGDVLHADTRNCYLRAEKRLLATIGIRDQIVVETADAVLVAAKEKAGEVKALVQQLKRQGRNEAEHHLRVCRPWGSYEGIAAAERFQVKRIVVEPGASLSLQKHHHRAEHWVVVKGTATVTCGERTFLLSEDQSTYIPIGALHRLENQGRIPLELIEVQTGSYLGEDDIVRLEDRYGRSATRAPTP